MPVPAAQVLDWADGEPQTAEWEPFEHQQRLPGRLAGGTSPCFPPRLLGREPLRKDLQERGRGVRACLVFTSWFPRRHAPWGRGGGAGGGGWKWVGSREGFFWAENLAVSP